MPQQTIYSNVQHYLTDTDHQDIYTANAGNNVETKIFDENDDLRKQKKKSRRQYNSGFTLNTIWKTITAPNASKLLQKAKVAYENDDMEKALNVYSQVLQAYPTNYVALYNRAWIKRKMGNIQKAMFDIETAIEVNNVYDNTWYQSLNMYVNLQNKKQDIRHIGYYYQENAFDVIYEFVNKLEHFDVKWFKHLVDSFPSKAMHALNDINQWQSLCSYQYGTDNYYYTRWYKSAVTWYNEYNNTPRNHTRTDAFFEKVFYMHKSKELHLIA